MCVCVNLRVRQCLSPLVRHASLIVSDVSVCCPSPLQTWFIEVNSNPCLELACPYLARIIPRLLEHTVRLCVDAEFGGDGPSAPSGPPSGNEDTGAACGDNRFMKCFEYDYPPKPGSAPVAAAADAGGNDDDDDQGAVDEEDDEADGDDSAA